MRKPAAGLVPGSSSVVGCSGEPASAGQACHNRSGLRPSAGVQREWGRAAGLRGGRVCGARAGKWKQLCNR